MKRNRLIYFVLFLGIVAMGLLSRQPFIPAVIYPYIGDVFYAMMMYALLAVVFNKKKPLYLFALAIAICYTIELSQLYQANWINAIRQTRLGGLILGYGFLWSDLLSYLLGAGFAFIIESSLVKDK